MKLFFELSDQVNTFTIKDYHYFIIQEYEQDGFIDIGDDEKVFLEAVETSLSAKKGVFIVNDLNVFNSEVDQSLLKKHFYVSKNSWVYLAQSLKNKVHLIKKNELFSFDSQKIEKHINNLFSE